MYSKRLLAGWSDMDFNAHMKNTAFLDKAADVRLMFFAENGFPTAEVTRLRIGPVVVRDEIDYRKEVELLQEIDVTLALAGMSPDAARWLLRTEVRRTDGKVCARATSDSQACDERLKLIRLLSDTAAAAKRRSKRPNGGQKGQTAV